ncbi:hypothetical protein RJ641_024241 [Dillenia turbinata]|uniref:Uncharacterized protein n=1 Tax=Dillenia turbinata TaxID=194707 RepID=A0AAN8UK72_9MAGN
MEGFVGAGIRSSKSPDGKERRVKKGLVRSESARAFRRIPSSPPMILNMRNGVDCMRKKPMNKGTKPHPGALDELNIAGSLRDETTTAGSTPTMLAILNNLNKKLQGIESFSGGRIPTKVSTKNLFFIHEAETLSGDSSKLVMFLVTSSPESSGSHLEA